MSTTTMSARLPVVAACTAARHLSMAKSTAMRGAMMSPPTVVAATTTTRKSATFRRRRHGMTVTPRAGWNDFEWGSAKVVSNKPASKEGGLHSIVVSVDADQAKGYTKPGQFIQMRTAEVSHDVGWLEGGMGEGGMPTRPEKGEGEGMTGKSGKGSAGGLQRVGVCVLGGRGGNGGGTGEGKIVARVCASIGGSNTYGSVAT